MSDTPLCGYWKTADLETFVTLGDNVTSFGAYYPSSQDNAYETDSIQYELSHSDATAHDEFLTEFFLIEAHELAHWANEDYDKEDVPSDHSERWEQYLTQNVLIPIFLTDTRNISPNRLLS